MNEGQIAIAIAVLSVGVALYSALVARKQAQQAEKDVQLTIQSVKSDATIHFTDRFFDLLKEISTGGIEYQIIKQTTWAYQFWSLQSTEFYFFHHGILPTFMYSLWMVDLGDLYAGSEGEKIWTSHVGYLDQYSLNYDEMREFFEHLFLLARKYDNRSSRNKLIALWIKSWVAENQRPVFE